jgi:hypothetical protein
LLDAKGKRIDSTFFVVNFKKGTLIFKENWVVNSDSYYSIFKIPEILTKEYRIYDPSKVVSNEGQRQFIHNREQNPKKIFHLMG